MYGRPVRLLRRQVPVSPRALLHLAALEPQRYPVLFDSASLGRHSQYSVVVATDGRGLLQDQAGALASTGCSAANPRIVGEPAAGFLQALDRWWRLESDTGRALATEPDLPWCGGFAVFLGYEVAAEVEPVLHLPRATDPVRAVALRTPAAVVLDHATNGVIAVAEPGESGSAWLDHLERDLRRADASSPLQDSTTPMALDVIEDDPAAFVLGVRRVQQYIAAGDLYQLNLSRGWHADVPPAVSSAALYARLRRANPAPFAAWWRGGGIEILSSSPERLFAVRDGRVSTRPIAGTRARRRAGGGQDDQREAGELSAHPKERAEHVMLIDLERNDLGRVCRAGSVGVSEFMTVETYEHVHHLVSCVEGVLRPDVTPVDVLRAVFPGGTITGCPKVRCMQLIAAIEGQGRGAYTGSVGHIGLDGSADFNILIRTLSRVADRLTLRAGAGIVADSVPERELDETRAKARGVLVALGARA
jgi:anthranilate synthase component I